MLKHPKLKGHVTLFPLSPTRWGVSGGADEHSRIELRNELAIRAFTRLLPLLDGRQEAELLLSRLAEEGVSRAAAEALLRRLEQAQLIEEADDHGLSPAEVMKHEGQIRFFARSRQGGRSSRRPCAGAGSPSSTAPRAVSPRPWRRCCSRPGSARSKS